MEKENCNCEKYKKSKESYLPCINNCKCSILKLSYCYLIRIIDDYDNKTKYKIEYIGMTEILKNTKLCFWRIFVRQLFIGLKKYPNLFLNYDILLEVTDSKSKTYQLMFDKMTEKWLSISKISST